MAAYVRDVHLGAIIWVITGCLTSQEVFCGFQSETVKWLWPHQQWHIACTSHVPVPLGINHQIKQKERDSWTCSHGICYF